MSDTNPFKGLRVNAPAPMTVLHRFTKPGGRWAEIRERKVTQFRALEFLVFVDGGLLESQMFHGARLPEYPAALAACVGQYVNGGWQQEPRSQTEN
jgi:hypothetical protein